MPITLGLYDIVVMATPAASRCQLESATPDRYRLQFVDNGIIIKERLTSDQSYGWRQVYHLRYDYIRRYGKRTNVFIIEAGRSCETGEGEFRFQSPDADKMFNLFRCTTEDILNQQHKKCSERGVDASPNDSKNNSTTSNNNSNSNNNNICNISNGVSDSITTGNSMPAISKGQLTDTTDEQSNASPPPLFRSGSSSSGHPTVTKDDSHIYSQVQKKRMAPNIPPRGTSLRKPSGFSATGSVSSSHRLTEKTPVTDGNKKDVNNSSIPSRAAVVTSPPTYTDKREPIYAELMQTTNSNLVATNGLGHKNRNAKTRCRSPAPLTDNFIRMEGFTQYATVVDFLPPQPAKPAQEMQNASDCISQNTNLIQDACQTSDDITQNYRNQQKAGSDASEASSSPVTSANQKKKAKTKTQKSDKKKKPHNDENKQSSSSWFSFFSGGNKKTASS